MFPIEIFENILSHISFCDIYRMRLVSKSWKIQCEHILFTLIKSQNRKLHIKIGEKRDHYRLKLSPSYHDFENQVIEFRKGEEESQGLCYLSPTDRRKLQIVFDGWKSKSVNNLHYTQQLDLEEYAQILFHYTYNAMLEQIYQLPTPFESNDKIQYIGDCGMIMSFSNEDTYQQLDNWENPVGIKILAVHVHLTWLLSGLQDSRMEPQPIYSNRYQELTNKLLKEGINTDYYPYSPHALKYVMTGELDLPSFISEEHAEPSRLEQLRSSLLQARIHPRVIWKYGRAKGLILNEQTSNIEENIEFIQKSEERWATRRQDLLNRFGH